MKIAYPQPYFEYILIAWIAQEVLAIFMIHLSFIFIHSAKGSGSPPHQSGSGADIHKKKIFKKILYTVLLNRVKVYFLYNKNLVYPVVSGSVNLTVHTRILIQLTARSPADPDPQPWKAWITLKICKIYCRIIVKIVISVYRKIIQKI